MAEVRERRADIAGTEVAWREADVPGAGPPTLYLHGVPNNGALWLPFLERAGGIAPDLPGYGRSGKSAGFDYSIAGYAEFLRAFVDHLGLERVALAMHDWGAVGLRLAQDAPELVERVVLVSAVPFLPGYRWHAFARIWRTPLLGELFMGSTARWSARLLLRRMGAVPASAIDRWLDEVLPDFDHGTQRAILRLYRSAPPEVLADAGRRLGEVRCPALVVWGGDDPFIPASFAHAYAEALGGDTRVDVVDGGGHWLWWERPDVVEPIASFLGGETPQTKAGT